jgi:hypothetical protein
MQIIRALAALFAVSGIGFAQSEIQLLPPIDAASTDITATEIPVGENVFVENTGVNWYSPVSWFTGPHWKNSIEIGVNGSDGNAESFSLMAAGKMKRETDGSVFGLDAAYGKTQANGVQTQNYALANSRWDLKFGDRWFTYNKNVIEFDEFKAFDTRLVLSGGLGRHFLKNDITTLTGRLGAGVSREFGGPDDSWVPEGNVGWDFEHKINELQKITAVFDYYPSWEDFADHRFVTKVDWELLLSKDANLSLKLGAIDRYDSTPNGAVANDIDYYLTFILKL